MDQSFSSWINTLQPWLVNIINSGQNLYSEETINKGADLCIEQVTHNIQSNRTIKTFGAESHHIIKINSIHSTSNLFALRDNLRLDFDSKITVVYGANGAGKTSIVKLLDFANGGNVELTKNRFKKGKRDQNYIVEYLDNGVNKSFVLTNNVEPIKMELFDGEKGNRLISYGKQLSVEAVELKTIQELTRYCDSVKNELKRRSNSALQLRERVAFPFEYKETDVELLFDSLTIANVETVDKILSGIEWTEKQQKELDKIISELDVDNRIKVARGIEKNTENINTAVASIEAIIEPFTEDALNELKEQKKMLLADYKVAKEYSNEVFSKAELGDIGSDTWKRMWEAARDYSKQAYPGELFPVIEKDAVCVLCHQPLNAEAQNRLQRFEEYVNSSFENRLKESKETVEDNHLLAMHPNMALLKEQLRAAIGDDYMLKCKGAVDELSSICTWASEQKQFETPFTSISFDNCNRLIEKLKTMLSELAQEHEKVTNDEKFKEKESERRLLEGQRWITTQKSLLRKNAQLSEKANLYLDAMKLTSTNRLTSKAKELSERLLTDSYEVDFNSALELLGATNLHARLITGKAAKGHGSLHIVLESDEGERIKAEDVLSAGEQRVVSLAAFIADAVNKKDEIPFIFDDPVSSLDSDYEKRVAHALHVLADRRQVIVFTHRLSLVSALSEYENVKFAEIYRNEPIGCGLIDYDPAITITKSNDLTKSLKELKKRVQMLDEEMSNNPLTFGYREGLEGIAAKFRTMIESTIEIVLLDRIVTRFKREIHSSNIKELAEISFEECETIDSLMSKYSGQVHSQSPEVSGNIISSSDVQKDIDTLIDLIKKHNKHNNK